MNVTIEFPASASAAVEAGFSARRVEVHERISEPFELTLVAMSSEADIDFESVVGSPVTVRLDGAPLCARVFSGLVSALTLDTAEPTGLSTYALRVVPRLELLSQRTNCRVFTHATALAIAKTLLDEWKIAFLAEVDEAALAIHEVRVQYAETDLDFLGRILAEAGISYVFDDQRASGECSLVLSDRLERAAVRRAGVPWLSDPSHAAAIPYLANLQFGRRTTTGKVTIADFDFRSPGAARLYRADRTRAGEERLERYAYSPGAGLADLPPAVKRATDTPFADDQSFSRSDEGQGNGLAQRRLHAAQAKDDAVSFSTNLLDLSPGAVLTMTDSPRPEIALGTRMIVKSTRIRYRVDGGYSVSVRSGFAGTQLPPNRHPWPRVEGLQSAIVTGPPGSRAGDLHTDEFGRVRVRFPWDREGPSDDRRSAWVRVDDGWAGAGFGTLVLPRVGEEVLVAFLEGNPDQPLVIGRLHDASNPLSYGMPGSATVTGWRSSSWPSTGGYNELHFDDAQAEELVRVRSERDLSRFVVRDELETIAGDQASFVGNAVSTTVDEDDLIAAAQMHEVTMAVIANAASAADMGSPDAARTKTRREIIANRITLTSGGSSIVLDGPNITVVAGRELSIVAGDTVVIQGEPYVHINPPVVSKATDKTEPKPPPDHIVWYRVESNGAALAGVHTHLIDASGAVTGPHVTDGKGEVRVAVPEPGDYTIHLGDPPPPPLAAPAPPALPPSRSASPAPDATPPARSSASAPTGAPHV